MRALLAGCAITAAFGAGCGGSGSPDAMGGDDGPGPGGTKITVKLNNVPDNPGAYTFVAGYQDGSGAWKLAPAPSQDTFSFAVSSPTWGFAYTCQVNARVQGIPTNLRDIVEYQFAVAERTELTDDILARCTDRLTYVSLTGNVANRAATGTYRVAYNGGVVFIDRTTGNYEMLVLPGTHDLIVVHGSDRGTASDFLVDGAIVQRDVAVTATTTLNFSGNTTTATQPLTVTVPGTPISSDTTTNLFTGNGTSIALARLSKPTLESMALSAGQAAASDLYEQRLGVETVAGQAVTVANITATPAAIAFPSPAPPPAGATTTTSAATMPYPMFKSTWATYASAVGYVWTLAQTPPGASCMGFTNCTITWTAALSPGAIGASPSYTMPDLSHLPGWSKAFRFVGGTTATGEVTAITSSAGATDFPIGQPAAGTDRVFAHSLFSVTP